MRSALFISALAGLAAARPQAIDIDAVEALPEPTLLGPTDPTATAEVVPVAVAASTVLSAMVAEITSTNSKVKAKLVKKDGNCSPQPDGYGPQINNPDTSANWVANDQINAYGANAPASIGAYKQVFKGLSGSMSQTGYAGLITLQSYDLQTCASQCDQNPDCASFNIFVERDPTVDPGAACPNPPSITNFKCTLYDYPIAALAATNYGQYRGPQDSNGVAFNVTVASSNGYTKLVTPSTITNFTGPDNYNNQPVNCPKGAGSCAINVPDNSYITYKTFDDGKYDPANCAKLCQAQTAYNKAHPAKGATTYRACNYFNAYVLLKNGVPQGTYCSLYTKPWDASYATNAGQSRGSDQYTIAESFGFTLNPQDPGTL